MKMKTAEDVLKQIEDLDAAERWKLLSMLYDTYYNSAGLDSTSNHTDVLEY